MTYSLREATEILNRLSCSKQEAADKLDRSYQSVNAYIASGLLEAFVIEGRRRERVTRISRASVEKLAEQLV